MRTVILFLFSLSTASIGAPKLSLSDSLHRVEIARIDSLSAALSQLRGELQIAQGTAKVLETANEQLEANFTVLSAFQARSGWITDSLGVVVGLLGIAAAAVIWWISWDKGKQVKLAVRESHRRVMEFMKGYERRLDQAIQEAKVDKADQDKLTKDYQESMKTIVGELKREISDSKAGPDDKAKVDALQAKVWELEEKIAKAPLHGTSTFSRGLIPNHFLPPSGGLFGTSAFGTTISKMPCPSCQNSTVLTNGFGWCRNCGHYFYG